MKRCKICKGLGDVRADGLCGGCYDARMTAQFGMSYGKYIALYGHNLGRRVDTATEKRRRCPVCGGRLPNAASKLSVYCSSSCAAEAEDMRLEKYNAARRKTCRGCRYYVTGSKRCTNPDSQYYATSFGTACGNYARQGEDNGEN